MQGDISNVMVMTHGKNQSIKVGEGAKDQFTSTGDGKTNISGTLVKNIQDLPQPKGNIENASLLLYCCHSADNVPKAHGSGDHAQGDLKGTMQTVGQAFTTFNFSYVQGTKGAVNYHSFLKNGTPAWSNKYMQPYPENGQWIKYVRSK